MCEIPWHHSKAAETREGGWEEKKVPENDILETHGSGRTKAERDGEKGKEILSRIASGL